MMKNDFVNFNLESSIIRDFLLINSTIYEKEKKSRLPKIIVNSISKYQRNKLKKIITKFKNSEYILTKNNLLEFFIYTFNNFPPFGNYKSILISKFIHGDYDYAEAILKFDSYKIVISMSGEDDMFNITISDKVSDSSTKNLDLHLNKLETHQKVSKETIRQINYHIKDLICDYIIDNIKLFENRKEK